MSAFLLRPATAVDLPEWGTIAGEAFSFKPGDPGRFLKNVLADPEVVPGDIHLACRDDKIAAAVRVMRRQMYINGELCEVRGIGDVCTHPSFQRQGAANQILQGIMEEWRAEFGGGSDGPRAFGALHAAPAMRPFYANAFAIAGPSTWSCDASVRFRRVNFDDSDEVQALLSLYNAQATAVGALGWQSRSTARATQWLRHSIGATAWLAERLHCDDTRRPSILAYAATKYKRGETSLAEFVCSSELESDVISSGVAGALLFELLARSVVDAWGSMRSPSRPPSPCDSDESTSPRAAADDGVVTIAEVVCPTPGIAPALRGLLSARADGVFTATLLPATIAAAQEAVTPADAVVDDGWMYVDLRVPTGQPPVIDLFSKGGDGYLMWSSDFF